MPYTLGITIDGTRITDDDAKIIGLSIMGISYKSIAKVTFINEHCIRNKVSALYGLLDTREKHYRSYAAWRAKQVRTIYCHVNGNDILNADERRRLTALKPRILREVKRLRLILE
jgi:hypothetical protein